MARIAILGNTAGGKSTLARHLAKVRDLPHVEIDDLYWRPDWTVAPQDLYQRDHDAALAGPEWIIDGGGDLPSIRKRAQRATDLILLDLPLWVHFWRAAERQMAWANGTLEHPPGGGQDVPPTGRLFEIMWDMDREWMPILRDLCDAQEARGKAVVRLTSLDALDKFYRDA
ncbi:hypothetical protein [Mesobacterium pallidum]|uniref:hypothetical protein n=1 Tax=Mesobacterium pallidum TaxID=2872037 RepID=UPI001EE35C93|nr:hypothetical protein [Mesobacterium pallidum]